jgi:membrane-bound ClpP family serine protease
MGIIVALILLGLFLIVVEIFLIPGITLAGIGGLGCLVGGVIYAYSNYGNTVGHITLISTIALTAFTLAFSLRSKTWKFFMLNTNIEGNVTTEVLADKIQPGDSGLTISRLTPMGKVRINQLVLEAKSEGTYIDQKTEIVVVRFDGPRVIVKPKL